MLGSLLGAIAALTLAVPAQAQSAPFINTLPQANVVSKPAPPVKKRIESLGVKTGAPSVFVADLASGSVLYAKNPHRTMPIASLTKLMTAIVLLDQHPDLSAGVVIKDEDFDRESKPIFKVGDELSYRDLLKTMLVGSVNASANALARSTLGKEKFVEAMNRKVAELGLDSPHFTDPSGIDPGNQANAADIAALISIASGYKEIREAAKMPEVIVKGRRTNQTYKVKTTNLLLGGFLNKPPYEIVTAKTGSLPEAGYCMAQITRDAGGHEVIAVELGNDNHFARYQDIKALTYWAFETYEWR
jgi:D-alanyl-D-alanine endopeptidase (penicillin-binding protein 7)